MNIGNSCLETYHAILITGWAHSTCPIYRNMANSLHHSNESPTSGNPFHSQVSRWKSSSSSRKGDLQYRYEAIIFCHPKNMADDMIRWTQTFNRHQLRPPQYESDSVYSCPYQKAVYMLGSILCDLSPHRVLVGRARPWLYGWKWDISLWKELREEVVNPSFDKFVIQSTNFWCC